MHCSSCRFYYSNESQCRRYAPPAANHASEVKAFWPAVSEDDWCGEFQPAAVSPSDNVTRDRPRH